MSQDIRSIPQLVGGHIRGLRQAAGLTQDELAEALQTLGFKWVRQTVALVERGERPATMEEIVAVAAYFDMPIGALLVGVSSLGDFGEGVRIGERVVAPATWLNIVLQGRTSEEPPADQITKDAIDSLVGDLDRPWSRVWREKCGHPAEAFRESWKQVTARRRRFPGPIFLWEGDGELGVSTTLPPWGADLRFALEPGVPYTARNEIEASILRDTEGVRIINRQEAYRLRQHQGGKP